MSPPDLGFDYESCFDGDSPFKKSELLALRKWVEELDPAASHIPSDVSDQMLLLFYNACELSVEDTKKCIKTYYSIKERAPEHFEDRILDLPLVRETLENLEFAVLPEKTKDGYDIIFHRLHDERPEAYHFNPAVKLLFMTLDRCVYERGPQRGTIFLFDMKGVKLGHLTRVNIMSLGKFFTYIQDAMPIRIKAIHIMNVVPFFDKLMMLMKPFMKKELLSLMQLHLSTVDMEHFYSEVIPRRCLPSDFGGELPDTQTLNKENWDKLKEMQQYFIDEEQHRKKYTKKSKKKAALDKDFKNLSID